MSEINNSLFEVRFCPAPEDIECYNTTQLRKRFLIESLFVPNKLKLVYCHYDRMVVGGIMPMAEPVTLTPDPYMKTSYFNQERECGIVNVGGKGKVVADGVCFELDYKDALYLGRGIQKIYFESVDAGVPAKFYLNSCLAHHALPSTKVPRSQALRVALGNQANVNKRILYQYIVPSLVPTCQLMMGITEVEEGNAWNTMPCHVHRLRMEAYCYFEMPDGEAVSHFMGQPQETRHLWVQNEECVLSPDWSIHMAAGTHRYAFIWGMAGSDGDVDAVANNQLK